MPATTTAGVPFTPAGTALLIIDVQNDFLHDEGHFATHGRDVRAMQAVVPRIQQLLHTARAAGAGVVHVQQTTLPGGASDSPAWRYFKTRDGKSPDYTLQGSWGERFYEIEPRPGEPVVRKFRPSAFHGTDLARLLRVGGATTVVCCGVVTQGCVLATTLDASFNDFYTLVAADAVGSPSAEQHDNALRFLGSRYDLVSNDEVAAAWPAVAP